MNPDVKAKWLEALRSGEYRQGREELRHPNDDEGGDGYCCLGVLCDLYRKETGEGEWDACPGYYNFRFTIPTLGQSAWSMLPMAVATWAGIPEDPSVGTGSARDSLANLNDSGQTFEEIAARIEAEL